MERPPQLMSELATQSQRSNSHASPVSSSSDGVQQAAPPSG